jgi:UDP-glucose-4-epimerase GalE
MKQTILITGGAGYIGSHIALLCAQNNYNVIIIDSFVHNQLFAPAWATVIRGDFGDEQLLTTLFLEHTICAVIHCAAFIEVGQSVTDPLRFYENNVAKTITLLTSMRAHNVNILIFSSSCAVFGAPLVTPMPETHQQHPISPYGHTKQMAETILAGMAHAYGFNYVALRYFNAAGAWPEYGLGEYHIPETHIIPLLLIAAHENKPFYIFGNDWPTPDGTCIRDFVHVRDIAQAHLRAIDYLQAGNPSGAFNLGTGVGTSVAQIIAATQNLVGKKIEVVVRPRREGDPAVLVADSVRARDILGWQARYSGIEEIIGSAYVFKYPAQRLAQACTLHRV